MNGCHIDAVVALGLCCKAFNDRLSLWHVAGTTNLYKKTSGALNTAVDSTASDLLRTLLIANIYIINEYKKALCLNILAFINKS